VRARRAAFDEDLSTPSTAGVVYPLCAMADSMPVLVAPAAFGAGLSAPSVAAAIGRGLERAGLAPPDLCPLAGGGRGTIEVLLPVLGGETADGFVLIEDGGTAIVEPADTARATGARILAAVGAGVEVVLLAAAGAGASDGAGVVEAIEGGGGLRAAALVVLCEARAAAAAAVPGSIAGALAARYGAPLVHGAAFVLEQLDFDARMRASRALVIGEARLDAGTLAGRTAGEAAIRARQAGVPCHAVAAANGLDPFDVRILDLQAVLEAATIAALEDAGERLAAYL